MAALVDGASRRRTLSRAATAFAPAGDHVFVVDESAVELGSVEVGGGRRARIMRDGSGAVRWSSGGAQAGAVGNGPFVAAVPDGTLVCGSLPAGAVGVDVVAPVSAREVLVAGGVFLAVIPAKFDTRHVSTVFRDQHGGVVARPLPEHVLSRVLSREVVTDADTSCVACGACDWEVVRVRAKPHAIMTRGELTVCRVCGLIEGGEQGSGRRRPGARKSGPLAEILRQQEWFVQHKPLDVIRAAHFPVFGVDPTLVRKTSVGWQGHKETITGITLTQLVGKGEIRITSAPKRAEAHDTAHVVAGQLAHRLWESEIATKFAAANRSSPARRLSTRKHHRDSDAAAAATPVAHVAIVVNDQPRQFLLAEAVEQNLWAASCVEGDDWIAISGHRCPVEAIRIVAITTASEYLAAANLEEPPT